MKTLPEIAARLAELEKIEWHERTEAQDDEFHSLRQEARRLRVGSAREWSPIVAGEDGGGYRDFLDGRAIHCGTFLELQGQADVVDKVDQEIVTKRLETGVIVRYETSHRITKTGAQRIVVLYGELGGHDVTLHHEAWMRFRWPRGDR